MHSQQYCYPSLTVLLVEELVHVIESPGVVEDRGLEPVHALDVVAAQLLAVQERALELVVQLADPRAARVLVAASDLVNLVLELLKACDLREEKRRRMRDGSRNHYPRPV